MVAIYNWKIYTLVYLDIRKSVLSYQFCYETKIDFKKQMGHGKMSQKLRIRTLVEDVSLVPRVK